MALQRVTIKKMAELSGYTETAIRGKIRDGVWLQDIVWIKAPDGRILIDVEGYEKWAQGNQESELQRRTQSKSTSTIKAHAAASA